MRKLKIAIIIGIIFIGGVALSFLSKTNFSPLPQETINQEENIVVLDISYGLNEKKSFQSQLKEGMTAFSLLEETAKTNNINLKTKAYDIGILIEAIDGKENGQDESYWMYYVNGVLPMVASDKYQLKGGDKIEFKFEKSQF